MAINLLELQPNKVSRDLSGYITYIYGRPKTGKTTLASQMPKALILAFEPGYRALPGVMAQDITSWSEMRQVYRELKKPEIQELYKCLVVDTIDIAADRCKKYICQQNDIEDLGDLGYGRGWTKFKEEFNEIFRGLTQLGYAVYFIGHDKEEHVDLGNGSSLTKYRPALSSSARTVIAGMSDIYGFAHEKYANQPSVLTLRCSDGTIECGGRFKYLAEEIPMSYDALTKALQEAIDKEAEETGNHYVTDEKITPVPTEKTYDFEGMKQRFTEIVGELMSANQSNGAKITEIVNTYLGKGKKVSDCNANQAEQLELILIDLEELVKTIENPAPAE